MRKPFILSAWFAVIAGCMILMSCKKEGQPKNDRSLTAGVAATGCLDAPASTDSIITGLTGPDLYLSNTKRYVLNGLVWVTAGHTITIQHGTRILGLPGDQNYLGGGLIICRGAKIIAVGLPDCPIVFTSYRYDDPNVSDSAKSGDWAGIYLLGRAPINNPSSGDSTIVEGLPTYVFGNRNYGGANEADNSGILKYVRIEYAGQQTSPISNSNGLTLAGVGNQTIIDYVAVTQARFDAFAIFGGTVNASHLIALHPVDDLFDITNSYRGTIAYALGKADSKRASNEESNGIECDNDNNGIITPYITHPKFDYFTILGVQTNSLASDSSQAPSHFGRYGRGAHLRRNTEFEISNSIFMGYNYGISLDTMIGSTAAKYRAGISTIKNTYAHGFGTTAVGALDNVPYALENRGQAFRGSGFDTKNWFYTQATLAVNANKGIKNVNPNASGWLINPFSPNLIINNFKSAGYTVNVGSQINTWTLGATPDKWVQIRW